MAKKKKNKEVTKTPAVLCQNDLSGKLVEHFCSINEDDRRLAQGPGTREAWED